MARRKRGMLDDGDDSDGSVDSETLDIDFDNDPLAKEERELFENPYQRKRRRKNGKEDAMLGVFADDSDEEPRRDGRKSDWTKAPSFVTSDKPVKLDDAMDVSSAEEADDKEGQGSGSDSNEDGEDGSSDSGDEAGGENDDSDNSESRPASPRVRMEEDEEAEEAPRPRFGGLGSSTTSATLGFSKGGIGTSNEQSNFATQGFSRGGIGSRRSPAPADTPTPAQSSTPSASASASASPAPDTVPSAFASRGRSFLSSSSTPKSKPNLPYSEMAHFSKLKGTFGARMLEKMGWQAGAGLGVAGEGIVTPVESKLRPQKMGIAFKGFKEKTEQSKLEAKRRGEVVSDEDEDPKVRKFKKKAKEAQEKRADAWKRPKKVKTKVEHKTYEQIIAEAGEAPSMPAEKIIDATGAVMREVTSLADISLNTWTPTNDPTRIPEVRHNIRLISDACKSDLDGLAREARALQERKKFVQGEDARLRKRVEDEAELIARLQQVQLVSNEIEATARELSTVYEVSLEPFSPLFLKLINEYSKEYERYRLDEIVVAAIAPALRRLLANWNPLEDPQFVLPTFRSWRRALKINEEEKKPHTEVDIYGAKTISTPSADPEKPMTPFESLLWNLWLPRVRAAINNEWSAEDPQPAVKLYESWSSFLPPFIRDNILDQLILPKVQKTVADWNAKQAKVSLQAIVFPWLPHVGLRLEAVVDDSRRKIKALLRSWTVESPVPMDLLAWKDVFDTTDWDNMLLKYVVPKLGATLRADFRVNPRDQKLEPLQCVFAWSKLIRPSVFSQIIETQFFPKWLDVLHIWLIQPTASPEEISRWYTEWKEIFPQDIFALPGVSKGFTSGLQLMYKALELGPEAPTKLPKPDFLKELQQSAAASTSRGSTKTPKPSAARTHEITFKSIAEDYAASRNLLFVPAGRVHPKSRLPLYRVSQTADGRKGLLVYILDDAVWAPPEGGTEEEDFVAIRLDTMVSRAGAT